MPGGKRTEGTDHRSIEVPTYHYNPPTETWTEKRCFINAQIYGVTFKCLIDTGAARTFINTTVANVCRKANAKTIPNPTISQMADGSETILNTDYEVRFRYQGTTRMMFFTLFPNLAEDIILGMDTLTLLGLRILINNNEIKPIHHQRHTQNGRNTPSQTPIHGISTLTANENERLIHFCKTNCSHLVN